MLKSSILRGVTALLMFSILFAVGCEEDDNGNGTTGPNVVVNEAPEASSPAFAVGENYLLTGESVTVNLTTIFSDDDELSYDNPTSSDSSVAVPALSGTEVTVTASEVGRAIITLTARDTLDQIASTSFDLFVVDERLDSDVTSNATWSAGTAYLLTEQVFVKDGVTLTIELGTTIKALPDNGDGLAPALVVERGAMILAEGTQDQPITFTSALPAEELPQRGTWGGIIVLGNAPIGGGGEANVEGLTGVPYGGNDAADNSGILKYVRVWYGGRSIGQDNEINGITMAGVGSATTVEYCEVAYNLDDGFEMFGGTVNLKHCSVVFTGDDGFDTDQGYQGKGQFLFVIMGREAVGRGFEMDNNGDTPDQTPRSHPMFSNVTIIGPNGGTPTGDGSDQMLRLREGTGGGFRNMVVASGNGVGLRVSGDASQAILTQNLPADASTIVGDSLYFSPKNVFYDLDGGNFHDDNADAGLTVVNPAEGTQLFNRVPAELREGTLGIDPRPVVDAANPLWDATNVDPVPADPFFDDVDYVGAFGTDLWLYGWSGLTATFKLATH